MATGFDSFCGCPDCMAATADGGELGFVRLSGNPKWGASSTLGTDGGVVTWSLAAAGLSNQTGSGSFFSSTTVSLSNFLNFDYQAILRQAFDAWSAVANIEFIQTTDAGGNIGVGTFANIRIMGGYKDGPSNVLASAFGPGTSATSGDLCFDSGETTFWTPQSFYLVAVHEIGHTLGLNHEPAPPSGNLAIMNPNYNASLAGLQTDDINGIRSIYGAQNFDQNVYTMAASLTNLVLIDGAPNLKIIGNASGNVIVGTEGSETIDGAGGANAMYGGGGNDYITATSNTNVAFGDAGTDQIYFSTSQNQLYGGEGNDWLGVNGNNNALAGGNGDEIWMGASGTGNTLNGEEGNNSLFANGTGNALHGSNGNDWLGCSGSANALYGGAGVEWMGGSGTGNTLVGGDSSDTLLSVGSNNLYGEVGDDWVGCSGNNNILNGAQGNDYLAASGNNNVLDGGANNDQLVAGSHTGDRFVFHPGYGIDAITGFARHGAGGTDLIDLNGFGLNFSSLQPYLSDAGGSCVITINAITILTINGVTSAQLQASDFLF